METKDFLRSHEVLVELRRRGINLAKSTLMGWIKKGIIPKDYYVREIHGSKVWFRFKKDIVNYLENKIREKVLL